MATRIKVNLDGTIDYAGNHYVRERKALAEQNYDRDFLSERGIDPCFCSRCGAEVMHP